MECVPHALTLLIGNAQQDHSHLNTHLIAVICSIFSLTKPPTEQGEK